MYWNQPLASYVSYGALIFQSSRSLRHVHVNTNVPDVLVAWNSLEGNKKTSALEKKPLGSIVWPKTVEVSVE